MGEMPTVSINANVRPETRQKMEAVLREIYGERKRLPFGRLIDEMVSWCDDNEWDEVADELREQLDRQDAERFRKDRERKRKQS
jgi:hypothetical protein